MKSIEIESWALRILENVKKSLPVEDSLVELKAEWPEPSKGARRIAAHANAAHGENILWLIGVDEKKGIVGAKFEELSSWFPAVQSFFDGTTPNLQTLNINYESKIIVALCFDTSRLPFLVKNPAFGKTAGEPIEWEVPWREGTRTRSATRNDLIQMLAPLIKLPKIEMLEGEIRYITSNGLYPYLQFTLKIYVAPFDNNPVTFPFHKTKVSMSAGGKVVIDEFKIKLDSPKGKAEKHSKLWAALSRGRAGENTAHHVDVRTAHEAIEATADEIIIRGSGKIEIDGDSTHVGVSDWPELQLDITLIEAVSESKIALKGKFIKQDAVTVWHYGNG
jgi:hypothetical protein